MIDFTTPPTEEQHEFYYWLWARPWLCGCGTPREVLTIVLEVLEWAGKEKRTWPPVFASSPSWPDHPSFQFVVHTLGSKGEGLLEHGGSLYGSWLTADGKKRLVQLKAWGLAVIDDDSHHFARSV